MAQHFKRNAAKFSAYKTLQQTQLMANGTLEDAHTVNRVYNTNYLRAEQGHFIRASQEADNWIGYQEDKDIYPYLEFMPSVSANPRDSHKKLNGIIKHIDDPFWDTWTPPIDWECKCWVAQRESDKGAITPDLSDLKLPPKAIRGNPAKTKQVINNKHPMIAAVQKSTPTLVEPLMKWEACGVANRSITEATKFKRFGKGYVVEFGEHKHNTDYARLQVTAKAFAEKGAAVEILPSAHFKSNEYKNIYGVLEGTIYERKCPDLKVNGMFVEHEGFSSDNPKNALRNMLKHGLKQSDKLVMEDCGHTINYYKKRVSQYLNDKNSQHTASEIWFIKDGILNKIL